MSSNLIQFPSHPLYVAVAILRKYPSLEAAASPTPEASSVAVADIDIPGSRGAVRAALEVLRLALRKGIDAAVAEADQYWRTHCVNKAVTSANADQDATGRLAAEFTERLQAWKTK